MGARFNAKIWLLLCFALFFLVLLLQFNAGLRHESDNIEYAKLENRNITPIPEMSMVRKDFYGQLEQWYRDRLKWRHELISLWSDINYNQLGAWTKDSFVMTEDGWILDKRYTIGAMRDMDAKIAEFAKISALCREKGVPFILVVPPYKETVYREKMPQYVQKGLLDPYALNKGFYEKLSQSGVMFVDAIDVLFEAKKTGKDLYFKDDHHLSYYGSAVLVDAMLKKAEEVLGRGFYRGMELDGSEIPADKGHSQSTQLGLPEVKKTMAPWSSGFTDEIYALDPKTGSEYKIKLAESILELYGMITEGEAVISNKRADNGVRILAIGDSYMNFMSPYISQYVSFLAISHYNVLAGDKKTVDIANLIEGYRPDVVVMDIVEPVVFNSEGISEFRFMNY